MTFPILERKIRGKRLVYLDSAASAQKPAVVLEGEKAFYEQHYANVHRGVHTLAEEATEKYEEAREKVGKLLNASSEEVIFTSGTTSAINVVANGLELDGDIVVSMLEHHSNFVPWQQLAKEHGKKFKVIPLTPDFHLDTEKARELIDVNTAVVAINHVSNVLGTINPIKELADIAHEHNAILVVDGAQAVAHEKVDVKALDVDFYAISGHKMYGPSGIGALYGRKELLTKLQPSIFGGEMVREVKIEDTTWNDAPWKFEAGTPNIAGAVAMGFAADFLRENYEQITKTDAELVPYMLERIAEVEDVTLIGVADEKRGTCFAFTFADVHPHDVSSVLDEHGIAVRAGHHCTQPLHCALGLDATTRASFGIYNTKEDVDAFIAALKKVKEVFT
ncbi:MAG: SufS family cysteine desulfurase [Candidatus Woesearchaeota archaeon]|nr:SufS family cysteine desulfurase [Candidatus Woesearchaeota archaeon]